MAKFFVNEKQIKDKKICIKGDDVNHIRNVLRFKENDEIQICSREKEETYKASIIRINKEEIECEILEKMQETTESNVKIHIFQGIPKSDKMELIIQKATEIGVTQITPVAMEHCVSKIDKKEEDKKIARWQKIAEVAAKQSGRDHILKMNPICNIDELSNKIKEFDKVLMAYEKEKEITLKQELKNIQMNKYYNIGIIIGPEGGIAKQEVEKIIKSGAISITLGKRILRTETVALVMASIILYELDY